MSRRFLRFLGDNFITGIVVILPVILTVWILRFIIIKLNLLLLNPLLNYLTPYLPAEQPRVILAKTLIFIGVVLLIGIIGLTTRIFIVRKTLLFLEKVLYRLPMIRKIYGTTKDISSALLGRRKGVFKRVILIEYPRKGIYSIAFVTRDPSAWRPQDDPSLIRKNIPEGQSGSEPSQKTQKELISAYVPTTPNPTSGIYLLIPKEETMPLDMSVEQALKMVISSGIIYK